MSCRALLLGLLLALAAHAADVQAIDEDALRPQLEEFRGRLQQLRKQTLKLEEFVQYYQRQAQAKGTPQQQAINAYLYGLVLFKIVPNKDSKDTKDAKREFQRAIDQCSGFLPAYAELALIAEAAGDRTEAERLLRRTLEIEPAYVRAIIQLGQMAHRGGDLDRAKTFYNHSLDIKPTVEALSALVVVDTTLFLRSYDDREKEDLAQEALQAADAMVTLEPDNPILRIGKAEVFLKLGRVPEAIDFLERLYAGGTLKPDVQLDLLKYLRGIYQSQGDVDGVKSTIARMLKNDTLRPEDRARIAAREKDVDAMGRNAFLKWMVEDAIQDLRNDGLSVEQRQAVLRQLQGFIGSDAMDTEELRPLVWQAWCECFRVLADAPPELLVTQLRWMRNGRPPPRLMAVLVHFVYPSDNPEEVRVEGVRAVAACAGIAAIPAIYFSLQDDSGGVIRECDAQLSTLCERRSPLGGGVDAYTPDQIKQTRRTWAAYFHTAEGGDRLAKAFAQLSESVVRVQADRTSAPMIDHAANVILDDDVSWSGWAAAYSFLVSYWGKEFRPVERRGQPVEPFERAQIVKAFRENYAGSAPVHEDKKSVATTDAGMAKGE